MKIYDFKKEEKEIREFWEKEKIYAFNAKSNKKIFSIDTPPPTVSGEMHIGHAFSYAQQDFIARFKRMFGCNVFYPFGTDDNGLPTERLVEKMNNVKSKEMPRSKFIELCLQTLDKIRDDFVQQWKNIGVSTDYKIYYSTIDKHSQKISQKSFLDLYKIGRIYKAEFPSIWCPVCQTAIAQAELEDKEFPSLFTTIKFYVGKEILSVSTTRPELIPACVAVFVHPKDKRYKKFVGKKVKIPLFDYEVPIIADKSADMEKGTGAMMICSYGDKSDVEAINKYKLEPRTIFNYDGTVKEDRFKGLKIKDARERILYELKEKGFIVNQKNISHIVNVHDKCGTEIEFLPTDQWFIKILDKKKKWIFLGRKIKWHPEYMKKRYENWVNGLNWDWTISRDRHFGVPIPVWQCINCNKILLPSEKELPVDPLNTKKICPQCKKTAEPEIKVLDTWATSSLTPQIASALANNNIKIPYSLRPQAHDIIRTWAFYTIAKSFFHEKNIPWNDLMISGFVTLEGNKMSKSKGITISPKDVIDKYGADAIRFWAAGSKLGKNMDYRDKEVMAGKRFVTKLWNATNFVFMNLKNYKPKKPKKLEKIDELFLKKLDILIKSATYRFEVYECSTAKADIENFFWKYFCDNYLEIVKWRVYNGTKEQKESAFYTLYTSLLTILKLFAPITPFITEYIYQKHFRQNEKDKSIHLCGWPKFKDIEKERYEKTFGILVDRITRIRAEKTKAKKPMNAEIILTLEKNDIEKLKGVFDDLKHITNAKEIKEGKQFRVDFI